MIHAGEQITFKTVAQRAKVSRQYLYTNFKTQLSELRGTAQIPPKRAQGVDAALRKALTEARKEIANLKRGVERALGEAEHWREKCRHLATENAELCSKVGRR